MADAELLHGCSKDFYSGSSAFTRGLTNPQFNDQRVTILQYVADKQRWAVKLFADTFNGKKILVNEANLSFDHYAAYVLASLPSHLRIKNVEPCGEALYTTHDLQRDQVVFEELPMMVVNNGALAFDSRWNLHFGIEHDRGADAAILKAFDELSDGNQTEDYVQDARTLFFKMLKLSMGSDEAKDFEASSSGKSFVQGEVGRIAGVLARWQSNSHAFPLRGSGEAADSVSALFRYASKMLHSCEPNCICMVDPREGVMTVRTLKAVKAGELITNSYMGIKPSFMDLPLQERRALLQRRGFLCVCTRCVQEQTEIMRDMASRVAKAQIAEADAMLVAKTVVDHDDEDCTAAIVNIDA